jgi:hypothetical protein
MSKPRAHDPVAKKKRPLPSSVDATSEHTDNKAEGGLESETRPVKHRKPLDDASLTEASGMETTEVYKESAKENGPETKPSKTDPLHDTEPTKVPREAKSSKFFDASSHEEVRRSKAERVRGDRDSVESHPDGIDKPLAETRGLDKGSVEGRGLDKALAETRSLDKGSVEGRGLDKGPTEPRSLDKGSVEGRGLDKGPTEPRSLDKGPAETRSLDKGPIEIRGAPASESKGTELSSVEPPRVTLDPTGAEASWPTRVPLDIKPVDKSIRPGLGATGPSKASPTTVSNNNMDIDDPHMATAKKLLTRSVNECLEYMLHVESSPASDPARSAADWMQFGQGGAILMYALEVTEELRQNPPARNTAKMERAVRELLRLLPPDKKVVRDMLQRALTKPAFSFGSRNATTPAPPSSAPISSVMVPFSLSSLRHDGPPKRFGRPTLLAV